MKLSGVFHKQTFASWTPFNISSDTDVEQTRYICFLCKVSKHSCLNSYLNVSGNLSYVKELKTGPLGERILKIIYPKD